MCNISWGSCRYPVRLLIVYYCTSLYCSNNARHRHHHVVSTSKAFSNQQEWYKNLIILWGIQHLLSNDSSIVYTLWWVHTAYLRHSYNSCSHTRCSVRASVRILSVTLCYWLICDSNLQRVEFSPHALSSNKWMLMKIGPFSLVCAKAIMNSYYVSLWAWSKFNRQSLRNRMLLQCHTPKKKKTTTKNLKHR